MTQVNVREAMDLAELSQVAKLRGEIEQYLQRRGLALDEEKLASLVSN
jgi:hypothetical protein